MNDMFFDTLTRYAAAGGSPRAARKTLDTAGQAALLSPITADAKKKRSGKKAKHSSAKKARQKCLQQVGQCTSSLSASCDVDPICLAKVELCCAFLGSCDLTGWITCIKTA